MYLAQCLHDITTSYGLYISMLLAGLVGGFTHCAGMCSPFVLAQSAHSKSFEIRSLKSISSSMLIPYHLGRMSTYVIMAMLLSSLINIAFIYSDLRVLVVAPLLMLAGTIFFVTAFPSLRALFPWAAQLRFSAPYSFISQHYQKFSANDNFMARYFLGILLGFMPCGLVISALLASASATSVFQAAISMSLFTIGTMPALILIALGGQGLKYKFPLAFARLSKGAMVVSGLWLFTLAGVMMFE